MILYEYHCKKCGKFDEFNTLENREHAKCPTCGKKARQQITPSHLDYLGMGVSTSMPTAADKWAKMHEKEGRRQYE